MEFPDKIHLKVCLLKKTALELGTVNLGGAHSLPGSDSTVRRTHMV